MPANSQPNIFSEQQQEWLGEAMADQVEADFRPVRDPAQNAYVQAIADKLAATLPDTHIRFRVQLLDSSEVNGFSLAGGYIYLTRKLAASAKNDDELASVIGHEMGHIASHQFAFETTRDFKALLGVTQVGDRDDIYRKFQELEEARVRQKSRRSVDTNEKQDEADRIGVYVIAAAGYSPQATAEFWDRMFFTQGHKGGPISDFFGISKPGERRLGRITKLIASLPPGCGGQQSVRSDGFEAWHDRVLTNRRTEEPAKMQGVVELPLVPPVRSDLDRLRFSPDGTMLLAQDESSIFLISRDPLKVQFRVNAQDALPAQFSPDSKRLVFATQGLHTEEWSVTEKRMLSVHEPRSKHACLQAKLSPDGRTVVCLAYNEETASMDLSLLDAESGELIWERKSFFHPSMAFQFLMYFSHGEEWVGDLVPSSFSADGNYLLIGPDDAKVAFDLRTRSQLKVSGDLRYKATGPYAFVGSDRVVGVNLSYSKDSGMFSFPDGKLIRRMDLGFGTLSSVSATDGPDYVITDGPKDFKFAVADLAQGRFVLGAQTGALDVWNGVMAGENVDGTVGLHTMESGKLGPGTNLKLPMSLLPPPRAAALSPDARYIAISTRSHGGVWDLKTGKQQIMMRGFSQAGWSSTGKLYVEFPKNDKFEPKVVEVAVERNDATPMPYSLEKMRMEYGMLREWKNGSGNSKQIIVRKLADGSELWNKTFAEGAPGYTASAGGQDFLFVYPAGRKNAKADVKENPALAAELAAVRHKEDARLVEAVDAQTGKTVATVVLELSRDYAGADGMNRVGDLLYVTSTENRTLAYSIKDGRQVRQMFGSLVAVDLTTHRVCMKNREDEVVIYDDAGKELNHLRIGTPVRFASFTGNGSELLLIPADQVVRTLHVEDGKAVAQATPQS